MAEIQVQPEHRSALARMQHVLEWLERERDRLIADLNHTTRQGNEMQERLAAFLKAAYGIDPQQPWTLDVERGVIVTPDVTPKPEPESPFLVRESGDVASE